MLQLSVLKDKFQESACPHDLPIYDAGIDPNGIKIPFQSVIRAAAPHADILVVGDTNHDNPGIRETVNGQDTLNAIRDSGFTHIGVETSRRMQHWVDKLNDGALTRQEFESKIDMSLSVSQGNEDGGWTRQIGAMAEYSRDNNITFEFVDPDNGNQFCDESLPTDEYKSCDIQKWKDRFQDDALAAHMNANVQAGGKGLLLYGSAHFSVDNGTRDGISGNVVKVDIYQNRQEYEADKILHRENYETGINTNTVKPDMIYFKDTQTLHTTCETDPALKGDQQKAADMATVAIRKPAPAPQEQHLGM